MPIGRYQPKQKQFLICMNLNIGNCIGNKVEKRSKENKFLCGIFKKWI